jgi:hypothetical protein
MYFLPETRGLELEPNDGNLFAKILALRNAI